MADELRSIEQAAAAIARAAGDRALQAFRAPLALEFKGRKQDDPVTATDRELETFLRAELKRHFPAHGFVGEEQEDELGSSGRFVWTLDPLDGTANFASGLPLWAISLALLDGGRPVVACVWVPVGPDLAPGVYHASKGGGAWFDERRLAVSEGTDLRGRLITLPGAYWRTFRFRRFPPGTPRPQRTAPEARSLGSIAVEACLVATGSLRLALFVQPKLWDVAAAGLLVQEAGGSTLVWQERCWQPLECYEPMPPEGGKAAPALRHWARPVIVGSQGMAEQAAGRLAWQPRLPKRLRRLLGFSG